MCKTLLAFGLLVMFGMSGVQAADAPSGPHFIISQNLDPDAIIFEREVTDSDMAVLDTLPNLKTITFPIGGAFSGGGPPYPPLKVTDAGFAHIANCRKLEDLNDDGWNPLNITADGLKALDGLTELRHVSFRYQAFTDEGVSHLAGLKKLEELTLFKAGDGALAVAGGLPKLRVLHVFNAAVTDAGIAKLAGLTELEDLMIDPPTFGDDALKTLGTFHKLKALNLQHLHITNAGLAQLQGMHLRSLAINATNIGQGGLVAMGDMPDLEVLNADSTQVGDADMEAVARMRNLQDLSIADSKVTDAGLAKLARLEHLTHLRVNGLTITNASVETLLSFKKLNNLEIDGTAVSADGKSRLQRAGVLPAVPVAAPLNPDVAPPASPAAPGQIIRIAAGRDTPFTDAAGHVWLTDAGFTDGSTVTIAEVTDSNTDDPDLYRAEHYAMTAFSLAVPNGKYVVKLHFAENYMDGPGKRVFSFSVQGHEFKDFDICTKAGGVHKVYIETVEGVVVTDGKLSITFTPQVENPSIHALEIIPAGAAAAEPVEHAAANAPSPKPVPAVVAGVAPPGVVAATQPSIGGQFDPDVIAVGDWSETVNNIGGRLLIRNTPNGRVAYLELRNDPYAGVGEREVYVDLDKVAFEMRDTENRTLARNPLSLGGGGGGGGGSPNAGPPTPRWITLAYDSAMRLRLTAVARSSKEAYGESWELPPGQTADYFLGGTFTSNPEKDPSHPNAWSGTLKLPPMKLTLTGR